MSECVCTYVCGYGCMLPAPLPAQLPDQALSDSAVGEELSDSEDTHTAAQVSQKVYTNCSLIYCMCLVNHRVLKCCSLVPGY